ncbi:MAG: hypothetical protein A2283_01385 [Lentisphaerae bacterium RIFOXYA12_FULL_48_11]|nr:MAG: hypothetical protein A2283_01385 [Lentisphaerae bacterium RIFOXYA12_FULL_48_11]
MCFFPQNFISKKFPYHDGIDASRRILDENPDIKIIAFSVLSSKTAIIEMLQAGAMDLSQKMILTNFLGASTNIYITARPACSVPV